MGIEVLQSILLIVELDIFQTEYYSSIQITNGGLVKERNFSFVALAM